MIEFANRRIFDKRSRFFNIIDEAIVVNERGVIDIDAIACFIARALFFRSRRLCVELIAIRVLYLFISF